MQLNVTTQKGTRFGFPVVEMTSAEFSQLTTPRSKEDLKFMPFGSVIRCKDDEQVSPTVIGQLVRGEDAIAAQWGA